MNYLDRLFDKYPKTSFIIINKIWWVISFFFTIYIIQNQMPSWRQFILGSIYTIVTLPLGYYVTYRFGAKK